MLPRMRVVVVLLAFVLGCTKPSHGIYTALGGIGVGVAGVAVAESTDDMERGFSVLLLSTAVAGSMIVIGLGYTIAKGLSGPSDPAQLVPATPEKPLPRPPTPAVGWDRAVQLGDQAREAARNGDCARVAALMSDAQAADEEYYDTVLRSDPVIARCAR